MQLPGGSQGTVLNSRVLRNLLIGVLVVLIVMVLVIYVHAVSPDSALLLPITVLGGALFVLTVTSMGVGILQAWRVYPQHRRAILFVVGITLVTLLAHAYIIGSPPASDQRAPVVGPVGTQLLSSDKGNSNVPLLTVMSSEAGNRLNVTVTASGSDAIVDLNLAAGTQLTGPGFSPNPTFQSPLEPGSTVTGTWTESSPASNISLSYQSLNCYKTGSPQEYGCIMDEIFYVPEGMAIFNGQQCSAGNGAPTDCHLEHPFLVPALLAGGMAVFGEFNVVGWRVMPALLGTFSIAIVFGIAWKLSGNKKVAYVSATLLALDVMFFSQSSAALLDIPEIFFGLAAFFAYFIGLRIWKLDKYVVAGVLLGLSGLAKETAVFLALALVSYIVIFGEGNRKHRIYSTAKVLLVVALVFAGGLEAYDAAMVTAAQPGTTGCSVYGNTFVNQVGYILCYGSSLIADKLACSPVTGYWCKFANDAGGPPILPTDWVTYYSPVAYYSTSVSVCPNTVNGVCQGGQYSYVALAYYGVTNFLETWTIYVWIPLVAYAIYRYFKPKKQQPSLDQFAPEPAMAATPTPEPGPSGEIKFAGFALILFAWSWVPYLVLFFAGRVTYPFYFLPAVPAVAMGSTYWLTRTWFPKWLLAVYLVMCFLFFFIYFPEKSFLPDWLRVLIGH